MSSVGQPQAATLWVYLGYYVVDFGKKVHDRCARCDGNEVFGSVRKVTIGDKCVDSIGDGGLMSGSQIPVNPTIKSSVT